MGGSVEETVVIGVAIAATVATGGLAAAGAATAIGATLTGAAATTTIIGSATVGSVVGGAVIGAGVGAVTGAVQASLVGDDILEGALTGGAVGALSGGAGIVGAGAGGELAAELGLSTVAGSVDADLTKAVVEASKGGTAFATGAAVQDQNVGEWAAVGALTGAATPLVTAGLNYSGMGAGDTRNIVAGTVGGALAGGGSAAVTGGDVGTGALTGAASGLVGSVARPYLTDLANTVFGTGAAAPTGAQALNAQERGQLAGTLAGTATGQPVSNEQFVENAYQALFGRPPEAEGMAYWTREMAAGATPEQTLNNMIAGASAGDAAAAARFNAAQYLTTPLSAEIGGDGGPGQIDKGAGEFGGDQDVEVIGDYETTPKGGTFTQEIVPDEGAVTSEYDRGASESANLLRDLFTFGAEQGVGGSKTVVPFGAGGVTEADRAILETTGLMPYGADKGTVGGDTTLTQFGGGGGSTGTGMAGTGFGDTTLIGATSGPGTTLTSFGQGGGSGGGGGAEAGGGTSTSTGTTGGTTGGGQTTGRPDVTRPPGTRREEQVRISPIVTDPRIAPTVQRQAASQPVLSAGLDPATSGVILSRFGNKNQVWNEATLRLADALGLL